MTTPETILNAVSIAAPTAAAFMANYAVHSTVLLGTAWACTRKRSPLTVGAKEAVWKSALSAGILTAAVATAFPSLGVVPKFMAERLPSFKSATPAVPVHAKPTSRVAPMQLAGAPLSASELRLLSSAATSTPTFAVQPAVVRTVTAPPSASLLPTTVAASTTTLPQIPLTVWASAAWIAIASLGFGKLLAERARLSSVLGPRERIAGGRLRAIFDELSADLGLLGETTLTRSDRLSTPIALPSGEVCVPTGALERLPVEQQRCILAHELAHVARRDPQWLFAMRAIETVLFFQPLNRIARRNIQELAEFACDDAAADSANGGEVAMASSLASAAEWLSEGEAPALAAAMASPTSVLVRRVERLLGDGEPRSLSTMARALLVIPALATVGAVALSPSAFADGGTTVAGNGTAPPEVPVAPKAPKSPTTPRPSVKAYVVSPGSAASGGTVTVTSPGDPVAPHAFVYSGGGTGASAPQAYVFSGEPGEAPVALAFDPISSGTQTLALPGGRNITLFNGGEPGGAYAFTTGEGFGGKRNVIGVSIRPTDATLADQLGLEEGKSTIIDDVVEGSEAEKAGVKPHDIVLKIDGKDADNETLRETISEKEVGQTVDLEIRRKGQTLHIPVKVTESKGGFASFAPLAEPGGLFTTLAPGNFGAPFDDEWRAKLEAELEAARAAGGSADAYKEAMERYREAMLELERSHQLGAPQPSIAFDDDAARKLAEEMRALALDQERMAQDLARMHSLHAGALARLAPEGIANSTSRVREAYVELLAKQLVDRLTAAVPSANAEELAAAATDAAMKALGDSSISESITCSNDECNGTISVDWKQLSAAIGESLRGGSTDLFEGDNAKAADDAIRSVCKDNQKFKLKWSQEGK